MIRELHHQGTVGSRLQPLAMMKDRVIVAGAGVIAAKGELQVIIEVVFQEQAFHVHLKLLLGVFAEDNFAQYHGPGCKMRREKKVYVAHSKAVVGEVTESDQPSLRRAGIGGFVVYRAEAGDFDSRKNSENTFGIQSFCLSADSSLLRFGRFGGF